MALKAVIPGEIKSPRERYENDSTYHALVDTLKHHLHQCDITPSEIRQACLLACTMYEMEFLKSNVIPLDADAVNTLKDLEKFIESKS